MEGLTPSVIALKGGTVLNELAAWLLEIKMSKVDTLVYGMENILHMIKKKNGALLVLRESTHLSHVTEKVKLVSVALNDVFNHQVPSYTYICCRTRSESGLARVPLGLLWLSPVPPNQKVPSDCKMFQEFERINLEIQKCIKLVCKDAQVPQN